MTNPPNDDLFAESTMTFGEHLEELRSSLFRAIVGLVIGFLIGCLIANQVVKWIQGPVVTALRDYESSRARDELAEQYGGELPPEIERMVNSGFVPMESMLIEPFGFLERLERDYPDQFQFDVTPHKFVPGDIKTGDESWASEPVEKLAAVWRDAGQSADPSPGKEMWRRLSASQRETVDSVASDSGSEDSDAARIVHLLNNLLEERDLHKTKAIENIKSFSDSLSRKGVDELRDKRDKQPEEFTADDSRRLNRFLIAAHFDDYLHPPRMNVVELPTWRPVEKRLQALNAQEAFMIWIKAALVAGAVISSPWMFYQIWVFVAAGLYPHEKKYVFMYLPISLGLFFAGAALAFFFVFDPVLDFLFSFNKMMNIDPDPRIGEWLGFVLFLPIGFGISFQLPLVMLFLNRIGIFSVEAYLDRWRIAVLVIFVLSMLLTPADPVSMMLMATPLTLLYFGGIGMCRWMPRGRNPFDEAYEPS